MENNTKSKKNKATLTEGSTEPMPKKASKPRAKAGAADVQEAAKASHQPDMANLPFLKKMALQYAKNAWVYTLSLLLAFTFCYQQYQLASLTEVLNLTATKVLELDATVDTLTSYVIYSVDLEDYKYYSENKLIINKTQTLWEQNESEYVVYFMTSNCSYCEQAQKKYIIPFILGGHTQNLKIYFVNVGENEFLYATAEQLKTGFVSEPTKDNFYIVGTPTALHIKDGKAKAYLGVDDIGNLLKPFQDE